MVRFQRALDLYDIPAGARPDGPLDPSMPLYLEQQKYVSWTSTDGSGENPALVALDPATGRETTVAIFHADLAENREIQSDSRLWVSGYAWARGAVVATGGFRGRLRVEGLDASSESSVEKHCRNIDPGYCCGSLKDEKGKCKFGTVRFREYAETLFLARIPVGRSRYHIAFGP